MAQPVGQLEKIRAIATANRIAIFGGVRADSASTITVYNWVNEKPEATIAVPAHVHALLATATVVIAACSDGKVRMFDGEGKPVREIDAHKGSVNALAIHPNGKDFFTGGADGALRVFSIESGKRREEHRFSSRPLRSVAIDPAGESLAAAGDDGVIRVLREGDDEVREMAGHDGPVTCISFTPSDGRLVSGGEDGTVRVWYLVGAVEGEVRTKDDTQHVGGTTALLFPPAKDEAEYGERLVTAGMDGKIRIWRMSDRRKPRTLDAGSEGIHALGFAKGGRDSIGSLIAAGDNRTIYVFPFDAAGAPTDRSAKWQHGFDVLAESLAAPAKQKREAAVKTLAELGEVEAFELLVKALSADRDPEIRAIVATELADHGRRTARRAIRLRLDDEHATVRAAALAALRKLESDVPLSPLRAALDSRYPDTRIASLEALPALFTTSPLVSGLIASKLADEDANVRRAALRQLVSLSPPKSVEPLRTAFERGHADVRAEVLVRGALSGLATSQDFSPLVGKGLDDADADVRRVAFSVMMLTKPSTALWLESQDEAFARALADVVSRAGATEGKAATSAPAGVDPDAAKVKSVSQFFAHFVHPKHGDVAIFKPNLHTPIKEGDTVYLVGIKPVGEGEHKQLRADDYMAGELPKAAAPASNEMRERLVGSAKAKTPAEAEREPLLAALACRTPDTSLRGARGLALLGDMRALGALLTISREPDAQLRREAAFALVALDDPRAKKRLAWMMNDSEAGVRDAALTGYSKLEKDSLAIAEVALQSSHEDVRVRGLDILVKEGKGKAHAETLLGDAIEDESSKVRGEAFRTLWAWHDTEPLGPIDRALTARFPDLRLRAVKELATFSDKDKPDPKLAKPALERLAKAIGDRDLGVAKAAYEATLERKGKEDTDTHLAAIASTHPTLRAQGAKDAVKSPPDKMRSPLLKLLEDSEAIVRTAAIEALDKLFPAAPNESGPVAVGLQSSHLDLRVRAAELLAERRDEAIIDPMRALLADKDLLVRLPPPIVVPLRQRSATALANVGSPRLLKYFGTELIKDDDPMVREQAARGLSNASRRGEEGYLLDLLGHEELPVRSWAAEGLARLGDVRALPVLTGTLRHEHPPIRIGAILSFAALGPEGGSGLLQGLEDPSREVQRLVLAIILARDLRSFRKGETPDLLTSALSSQRPEVRFAAARALELRISSETYTQYLVDLLMPEKPEKAADMEKWPNEETRARFMVGLAEALAGDRPEQRYAAAQALRLRDRPIDYFREVQRAVMPRSVRAPWVPDTTPRAPESSGEKKKGPLALLRRLFAGGADADEKAPEPAETKVSAEEQARLRQLAFGAYIGLLRQGGADDEAHRVRRDAVERDVDLVEKNHVSVASATPALARALDDPNHLVRQAAFGALRKVYGNDPEVPLALALASSSADVVRSALDEIATQGEAAKLRIIKALDSRVPQARKYAFDLLEKLSPPQSLEPLLAALGSEHPDIRIGVLERLATSQDARVSTALGKALESDHDDLRLRAAEMLAQRKDDRAADALGPWLRSDDANNAQRGRDALARLGSPAAVRTLAARFDDEGVTEAERIALAGAIAATRAGETAIDALTALFADEDEGVRRAAFEGGLDIIGPRSDIQKVRGVLPPRKRDMALAKRLLEAAARSKYPDVRKLATSELDDLADPIADTLLTGMFGDRDPSVRAAAVAAYAKRVEKKGAPHAPLEDVLRAGARDTMLAAAEGLAFKGAVSALRPLLLFARAGEPGDRERALVALGTLGDKRALAELETIASGGTEEAPAEVSMQAAALEGLGRLAKKLPQDDADRIRDRIESSIGTKEQAMAVAAVRALYWLGGERSRSRIELVLGEGSSSEAERVLAAKSLGDLSDPASEKALAAALKDDDDDVRWAARDALEKVFPNDRTRIELHAVESYHDDISEPAAAYLANEGDAGVLLEKLTKLKNETLRQRLRFGLVRRETVPAQDLAKLLAHASPSARADAAWVIGARASSFDAAAKKMLGPTLTQAAVTAEKATVEAVRLGKENEREAEARAWLYATWAARAVDAGSIREGARRWLGASTAPQDVRAESAFALHNGAADDTSALVKALSDMDVSVRSAAASALAPRDPLALATSPLDPVRLGLAAEGAPAKEPVLEKSEGRRAMLPSLISSGEAEVLIGLAKESGAAQLDAIGALSRIPTDEVIEVLGEISSQEDGSGDENVRKAAYRALRRAQRTQERLARSKGGAS